MELSGESFTGEYDAVLKDAKILPSSAGIRLTGRIFNVKKKRFEDDIFVTTSYVTELCQSNDYILFKTKNSKYLVVGSVTLDLPQL